VLGSFSIVLYLLSSPLPYNTIKSVFLSFIISNTSLTGDDLPDIIIWMLCGNERTAYFRIPAHEIIYSSNQECKGELCGVIQTMN
jgi:hypothetical protein